MNFAFSVQPHYLLHNTTPYGTAATVAHVVFFIAGYVLFRIANLQKHMFKQDPTANILWTGKKPETIKGRILVCT